MTIPPEYISQPGVVAALQNYAKLDESTQSEGLAEYLADAGFPIPQGHELTHHVEPATGAEEPFLRIPGPCPDGTTPNRLDSWTDSSGRHYYIGC